MPWQLLNINFRMTWMRHDVKLFYEGYVEGDFRRRMTYLLCLIVI